MQWNEQKYTTLLSQCSLNIEGTIIFSDGSTRDITNADIPHGGISIEKRAVTGDDFEIGSVIIGELDLKLYISNSEDIAKYYDATINLKCYVDSDLRVDGARGFYVTLGTWTFVDIKKRKNILEIAAYDSLLNLDQKLKSDLSGYPIGIISDISKELGIEFFGTNFVRELDFNFNKLYFPVYGGRCTTYRQVISAIAQMCGCFVTETYYGKFEFKRFDNSPQTALEFSPSNIYTSNISAFTYTINSLVTEFNDTQLVYNGANVTSGQTYYMQNPICLEMLRDLYGDDSDNVELINTQHEKLGNILTSIAEYRPCELSIIADPRIECGDRYVLRHDEGVDEIIITGYRWTLHDKMEITCAGKDARLSRTSTSSSNYNSYYINEVEETSIAESAIILHEFKNRSKVVSDEDFTQIADVTFLANRDTFVTFNGTLQVDVDVDDITEEAQITIGDVVHTIPYKRDGYVDIYLLYKFNSDWIGPRYKHTLTRGSHIITLHYPLISIEKYSVSSFGLYISSNTGTVSIDEGMFIGTITGQGIAKALTWDGAIVLEDFTAALTIPENNVTFVEFNEQIKCEYVQRNDTSFSDVVDNDIVQAMTMADITDTVQLSTVEGE